MRTKYIGMDGVGWLGGEEGGRERKRLDRRLYNFTDSNPNYTPPPSSNLDTMEVINGR